MLMSVLMCTFMSLLFLDSLYTLISFSLISLLVCLEFSLMNETSFSCNGLVCYDFLSMSLMLLSSYICLLSFISAKNPDRAAKFMALLNLLFMTLCLAFSVTSCFLFFFMFESVLIILVFMILGWGVQPERLQACTYMFIYTVFGSLFFLLGISLLYHYGFSASMGMMLNMSNKSVHPFWWVFLMGFLIKMPMYPFHLWLPKAHVEAPVFGSMLLAGVVLKLGGYGLVRFFSFFDPSCNGWPYSVLLTVCLLGGVYSSFICVRQVDLKCYIAYSSVTHMSLVVLGVLCNSYLGMMGAIIIMIGHGLCSSGLFSCVTLMYKSSGSRSMLMNKGYLFISPLLCTLSFLLMSSNMAAPPSLNLLGEILIFISNYSMSWFFFLFLSIMSFMTVFYSLFLYISCCHGKPSHYIKNSSYLQYSDYVCLLMHWLPLNGLVLCLA